MSFLFLTLSPKELFNLPPIVDSVYCFERLIPFSEASFLRARWKRSADTRNRFSGRRDKLSVMLLDDVIGYSKTFDSL